MPQKKSKHKYRYLSFVNSPRELIRVISSEYKNNRTSIILLMIILAFVNHYLFIYEELFDSKMITGIGYIIVVVCFLWFYVLGKAFKGIASYREVFIYILLQNFIVILIYILAIALTFIILFIGNRLGFDKSFLSFIIGLLSLYSTWIMIKATVLMYAEIEKISIKKSILITMLLPFILLVVYLYINKKPIENEIKTLNCGDVMSYGESLKYRMSTEKQEHLLKKFTKIYDPFEVPDSLKELIKFEERHGPDSYVISFFLRAENKKDFFNYMFSTDEANNSKVAKYFLPLANIDGTGSGVAFWIKDVNTTSLENAPIIELGSEGEINIVAKNLKDFLYMLSFGLEPMDGEYGQFSGDEYYRRESFNDYRKWLKDIMHIDPVPKDELKIWGTPKGIEALSKEAKTIYKESFFKWLYTLIPDPKVEQAKYEAKEFIRLSKEKKLFQEQLDQNESVDLYMKLAKNALFLRYINKAKFEDEKNYYLKALKLDSNNTKVMFALADIEEDKEALAYYKKIETIEKHPEKTELYYNMALAYGYLDDDANSLRYYKKHISLNPRPNNYADGDVVKLCKKLKLDPIALYEEVSTIAPNQLNYETLYDLYRENQDYENAFYSLKKLFKIKKLKDFEYSIWGGEFKEVREYDKALEVWQEGINKQPDDDKEKAYLYTKIADVYEKLHNKQKIKENQDLAISFYKKHIKSLDPEEDYIAKFYEKISSIYEEQKDYKNVVIYLKKAIAFEKYNDTLSEHYYYLAEAYKELDEDKEALKYAEKSLELMPEDKYSIKQVKEMKESLK